MFTYFSEVLWITTFTCSFFTRGCECQIEHQGVPLQYVTDKLEKFAQSSLAEVWDNVGLIIEPLVPRLIKIILLTNDLTENVLDEAVFISADLIISYHPPIFTALKQFSNSKWKERLVAKCISKNIAVYSPHTSWDVIEGGVNDWLASAFECIEMKPLSSRKTSKPTSILTVSSTKKGYFDKLKKRVPLSCEFKLLFEELVQNSTDYKLTIRCQKDMIKRVTSKLEDDSDVKNFYVVAETLAAEELSGLGRFCKLTKAIPVSRALDILKKHLGLKHLRYALARNTELDYLVQTIAFVAGAGGSALKYAVSDLKITGEATHHDVLDTIHHGGSIILTGHSNSERGFLFTFKDKLASMLNEPSVKIVVSSQDVDIVQIY